MTFVPITTHYCTHIQWTCRFSAHYSRRQTPLCTVRVILYSTTLIRHVGCTKGPANDPKAFVKTAATVERSYQDHFSVTWTLSSRIRHSQPSSTSHQLSNVPPGFGHESLPATVFGTEVLTYRPWSSCRSIWQFRWIISCALESTIETFKRVHIKLHRTKISKRQIMFWYGASFAHALQLRFNQRQTAHPLASDHLES